MSYEFLEVCDSKPLCFWDLEIGDVFIAFPSDGDDHGHGGFRGGAKAFVKSIPEKEESKLYPSDYFYNAKEYERGMKIRIPENMYVIKIIGISSLDSVARL